MKHRYYHELIQELRKNFKERGVNYENVKKD